LPQMKLKGLGSELLLGSRSSKAHPSAKSDTGCTVYEQSLCNFDHVEKIAAGYGDPEAKEIDEETEQTSKLVSSHKLLINEEYISAC
jgi:hypothetical protein